MLIELYKQGLKLEEIADRLNITKESITEQLANFKHSQKPRWNSQYSQFFSDVVSSRWVKGVTQAKIAKELSLPRPTVRDMLKRSDIDGVYSEKEARLKENRALPTRSYLVKIKWNNFSQCPTCGGKKIKNVGQETEINVRTLKNSYCMNCSTEWLEKGGDTYKIEWYLLG